MTETIFGGNVFVIYFDIVVWLMSHLLTWTEEAGFMIRVDKQLVCLSSTSSSSSSLSPPSSCAYLKEYLG